MNTDSILVVDDNRNVLSALRLLLSNHFGEVTLLASPKTLIATIKTKNPDIVLLDMNFSSGINTGNEGMYWLSEVRKLDPTLPVVLFTAYADIELAVNALKEGATDFVVKPWDNAKLLATLQAALSLRHSQKEVKRLQDKQSTLNQAWFGDDEVCWGASEVMRQLLAVVEKVSQTEANILITGENGTGKEVIAKKIHQLSPRSGESWVSVDMGAITETLFESELFGHVKGAFTDARTDRAGKFEAANNGTLFLDEIGNLSYPLQAKLLTALQSRQITRVGSNIPIPVNIRLVSATNRDLYRSVQCREFREDLLYRINTIQIEMPALRERREDIAPLAEFFLNRFARKYNKNLKLGRDAIRKLEKYEWPGNIRELQHTVEKAVILCETAVLSADDFILRTKEKESNAATPEAISLEEMEKILIERALKAHGNNLSAVAAELGVSRPTLYSKMKKYGL
ncbi:MAG: sigma-54 dependent transcriptional regulator [Bacteroidales bacterium]|jgi:DNA-binding NtrC family response regulator|nr:sigma-54 dependent transcriptional regulator [Bacteroidales bacterium]